MEKTSIFNKEEPELEMIRPNTRIIEPRTINWEELRESYCWHIDPDSGFSKGIMEFIGIYLSLKDKSFDNLIRMVKCGLHFTDISVCSKLSKNRLIVYSLLSYAYMTMDRGGENLHVFYSQKHDCPRLSSPSNTFSIPISSFSTIMKDFLDAGIKVPKAQVSGQNLGNDVADIFASWKEVYALQDRAYNRISFGDFLDTVKKSRGNFHNRETLTYKEDSISQNFHNEYVKPLLSVFTSRKFDINTRLLKYLDSVEDVYLLEEFPRGIIEEPYIRNHFQKKTPADTIELGFGFEAEYGENDSTFGSHVANLYYDYDTNKLYITANNSVYVHTVPKSKN